MDILVVTTFNQRGCATRKPLTASFRPSISRRAKIHPQDLAARSLYEQQECSGMTAKSEASKAIGIRHLSKQEFEDALYTALKTCHSFATRAPVRREIVYPATGFKVMCHLE